MLELAQAAPETENRIRYYCSTCGFALAAIAPAYVTVTATASTIS